MRFAQVAAVTIGLIVVGATLVSFTLAAASAPKSTPATRTRSYTARLALEVPSQPRYIATMLGVHPAAVESFKLSAQDIAARTSISSIAHRMSEDATLRERVPDYYDRFDPEEGEFDRLALARDLTERISLTVTADSEVLEIRLTDGNEKVAHELCKLASDVVRETNSSARVRRIQAARDTADRIERDLRAQLDALAVERANLLSTQSGPLTVDAAADLRERLIDVELNLVGLPETDDQHAVLVQRRDWLLGRLASAAQAAAERAQVDASLQYIDDQRLIKKELRAAAARAVLACEEELATPFLVALDTAPITESRE